MLLWESVFGGLVTTGAEATAASCHVDKGSGGSNAAEGYLAV